MVRRLALESGAARGKVRRMDAADLHAATLRLATLVKTLAHHQSVLAEIVSIQEWVSVEEYSVLLEAFNASASIVAEAGELQEELVKFNAKPEKS